jgi:uncharacterized protein YceK
MNLAHLVVTATLACLACGCGTFDNSIAMFYFPAPSDPPVDYRARNWVYGGVKRDTAAIRRTFSRDDVPLEDRIVGPLFIADLPLSAIFDTLNLPYTIPASQREIECERASAESPQQSQQNERVYADETGGHSLDGRITGAESN